MKKSHVHLFALIALFVMTLCGPAYALDAPFRLELRSVGGAAQERPLETWFFLEDGRAYATTGELCAYAKAAGEDGAEHITLAGGPFAGNSITVDAGGTTATADRAGAACGFGASPMPTPFRARLLGARDAGRAELLASCSGGAEGPLTYRYHVYDAAGALLCGEARDGALPLGPMADGSYEAFVTASDANGTVSDCASVAVGLADGLAVVGGTLTGYAGDAREIVVPDTVAGVKVTAIGEGAFSGCPSLGAIHLPDGITEIAEGALSGCAATPCCDPASATAQTLAASGIAFRAEAPATNTIHRKGPATGASAGRGLASDAEAAGATTGQRPSCEAVPCAMGAGRAPREACDHRPEAPDEPREPTDPEDPKKPEEPEDPGTATLPINQKARERIEGYTLYANPEGTGAQAVTNASLSGSFYPDVYQSIKRDPRRGDGSAELTLMIYLCGTDLERQRGTASQDLVNVLRADYDLSQVNVLVLAGGTMSWKSDVMQRDNSDVRLCLYYLDPDGVLRDTGVDVESLKDQPNGFNDILTGDTADHTGSMRLLGSYGQACMGTPEILLGFLDAAYDLFPADHYWLSLWNHGAGSAKGICFGDPVNTRENASAYRGVDIPEDPLTLADIEEALASSKIVREHGDLDILSMDACLMAGIEQAYNFSPYVRFMIASEETVTGNVPYDDYLGVLRAAGRGSNMSVGEIAVNAARSFISKGTSEGLEPATMSVYDLMRLDGCADGMNAFGYAVAALLRNDKTSAQVATCLEKSASRTFNFGHDEDAGTDYVDLYDLLVRLRAYLSHERREAAGDTEAEALYQTAVDAISELLQVPCVAYRGGLYARSYIHEDDVTHREDLLPVDPSASALTGLWNVLGYDYLSGVTVYFPRLTSTITLGNYGDERVFPGYVEMLEQYLKVTRTLEHIDKFTEAAVSLAGDYGALFDDMRVTRCTYVDKDGVERHGLALFVSISQDVDPEKTDGLDPVTAFTEVVDAYNVLVLRERQGAGAGDGERYDIVVGRSADLRPGEGVTGRVTLDEQTGELTDTSGFAFDLSMMKIQGNLVTATGGGTEGATVTDWGVTHPRETELRDALHDDDPAYAESWKDSFSGLDGAVHTAAGDGESVAYDAILIFGKDSEGGTYTYKGAIMASPDADDVSTDEDRWVPATAEKSLGITLYHYRVNDEKNALQRVEDKDDLDEPTISFAKGSYPTMRKVPLINPDDTGAESQEGNRFALEFTDTMKQKSVCLIDDAGTAATGDADGLFGIGGAVAKGIEQSMEQVGDGTQKEVGQGGKDDEGREAAKEPGRDGDPDPVGAEDAATSEPTGPSGGEDEADAREEPAGGSDGREG